MRNPKIKARFKKESAHPFIVSKLIRVPVAHAKAGCRYIDEDKAREVFAQNKEFTDKHGCYVYGERLKRSVQPLYVGCTLKQKLGHEALTTNKLYKINRAMMDSHEGVLFVAFVVPGGGRLTKGAEKPIRKIERFLIQYAALKNSGLINKREVSAPDGEIDPTWSIQGVVNSNPECRTKTSEAFRKMLGIKPLRVRP